MMRLLGSCAILGCVVVGVACGGDDSASGPTSNDGGTGADGSVDGGTNGDGGPNACPADACGGPCGPCAVGKACKVDADCASNACENDVCVQTTGCYSSGFCWENPRPTGVAFWGIRGTSPNDIWAVGDQEYVLHWNGKHWVVVPSGTDELLLGLSFADATHGWAVGTKGTIVFYDGTKWTKQANVTPGQLWDVYAIAPNDVWTVGDFGVVFHFDGTSWTGGNVPGLGRLHAVWAANKDDVWVAGANGTIRKWGGGTTWTPQTIADASTPEIHAFGGTSATNVWAGAYAPSGILSLSGTTWSVQKAAPSSDRRVEDIFALDATHVYAVGFGTVERWNGASWTSETVSPTNSFLGAWASSANDVWFAGASGELFHHDGMAWKDFGTRFTMSTQNGAGIAGIGAKSVIVVGDDGQVARKDGVTGKWTTDTIPDAGDLKAVSANGPNDIVAVGDTIQRWNGTAWKKESISKSAGWRGITRVTPDTPWIAGGNGLVGRWNGTGWNVDETTGTTQMLNGIWAADPANVWVVGDQGLILHWNGTQWEKETSPSTYDLNGVWGSSANDVWVAVAVGGKILHRVGGTWKEEPQVASNHLESVTGTGPNDVWFTGTSGAGLVHWDGAQWSVAQHSGANGRVAAVGSSIYVATQSGFVLRRN